MPTFGHSSKMRLKTLCTELVIVSNDAIEIIDFSVIETLRDQLQQDHYFDNGLSSLKWPDSKHNVCGLRVLPEAMDLWPYVPPFGALSGHPDQVARIATQSERSTQEVREFIYKCFARMFGVVEACASRYDFKLRWGGDWDGDGNLLDQDFNDLPHIELIR